MAADQGLIQASLQEALSKVGPDKTKFYKSQVDTPLAATINISSVFQKKNEEKQEAWDAIAEPVEVMMRKLSSGSDQLGGMHPANVARLKELQKEFYAAYGNKEKEDEIKFKIEQVASEINVIAAGFGKFGQSYLDGTLNITESNPEFYKSFGKIWDVDGKYDDVEFGWDDNNKLSVTTNGKTQKVTDLFNGLVLDNTAPSIELGNLGAKATKWAKWDSKAFKRGVLENMKTKEDYANLIGKDTFGDVSFKEALATLFDQDEKNDNPDIAGIMKNLGIVVDENNKATLYEAITDIHNKNFNLEQARNIASQWYTDGYGASKFKEGEGSRKGGKQGDLGRYLNINNTYSNDAVVRGHMADIMNSDSVVYKDGNGVTQEWKPTPDGGYMKDGRKISKDRLAKIMGLPKWNYGSVNIQDGGSGLEGNINADDLSGDRATVRRKLLAKLGENFEIERNWVSGQDIMIKSKVGRGKGGEKLQIGFNLGDSDALDKINRLIQKSKSTSAPSSGETPVSETNPLG